jgi:glucan phosphoethanolaminetransferase (alkaline phosphatase superfamily)
MMELGSHRDRSIIVDTPLLPLHSSAARTHVEEGPREAPSENGINSAISMNTIFSDIDEEAVPRIRTTLTEDMLASFEEIKDVSFGELLMSQHWVYVVFLGVGGLLWKPCGDIQSISLWAVLQNILMVMVLVALSVLAAVAVYTYSVTSFDYASQTAFP